MVAALVTLQYHSAAALNDPSLPVISGRETPLTFRPADCGRSSPDDCGGPQALERRLRETLSAWADLEGWGMVEGRDLLRTILIGRLRFTPMPERRGYRFAEALALAKLLEGVVELPAGGSSPTGVVPEWTREGEVKAA